MPARDTRRAEVLQEETKRRRVNVEVSFAVFLLNISRADRAKQELLQGLSS